MGRIKTKQIKRLTNNFMEMHGEDMKSDFNNNKKVIGKYADIKSKKIRNTIAGYATRLAKKEGQ
jgi:small subunit ribosomal protein S17e